MRLFQPIEVWIKELPWTASAYLAPFLDPAASELYDRLSHFDPPYWPVKVLPQHKLLYLVVPKAASTRIQQTLAEIDGRHTRSLKPSRRAKFRGPYNQRTMTVNAFFRLVTHPDTLRFSFVRNPYARAVSGWAYLFRDKPLVPGDIFVDDYLAQCHEISADLPAGADRTLSFPQFVAYVAAVAPGPCNIRIRPQHDILSAAGPCNIHIRPQHDILSAPGIKLNFLGKVETFDRDFARILDHVGASSALRREAVAPLNQSRHDYWSTYYTPELADRFYRAYERDFDRFGYPRTLPR